MKIRVGFGYDSHRLVQGRELWLGGVRIDSPLGLEGHSDADVLLHAVCDALLGAASLRDIGYHFPDTSEETLGMRSAEILARTVELLAGKGYRVGNIDATVCAEKPKLSPYIDEMCGMMADLAGLGREDVSVKATTNEKMGFVGRGEGIAAFAVALVEKD